MIGGYNYVSRLAPFHAHLDYKYNVIYSTNTLDDYPRKFASDRLASYLFLQPQGTALISNHLIPRDRDIDQVQCYSSLFDQKIGVANLTLLYADLKNLIPFNIQVVNKLKWIEDRILQLYLSVHVMRSPPEAERSLACGYCKFKEKCDLD